MRSFLKRDRGQFFALLACVLPSGVLTKITVSTVVLGRNAICCQLFFFFLHNVEGIVTRGRVKELCFLMLSLTVFTTLSEVSSSTTEWVCSVHEAQGRDSDIHLSFIRKDDFMASLN